MGAFSISPSVHTHTVSAKTPTDPAKAVRPKPYPARRDETMRIRAVSRRSMNRVTGICSATIRTPLTAMAKP